jgi:hypothetical protein
MASQQAERAAELQDPEIRAELDRRVREEGETVVKSGGGGTTLDAQERLAEGELGRPRRPRAAIIHPAFGVPCCVPCRSVSDCSLLLRQGARREG